MPVWAHQGWRGMDSVRQWQSGTAPGVTASFNRGKPGGGSVETCFEMLGAECADQIVRVHYETDRVSADGSTGRYSTLDTHQTNEIDFVSAHASYRRV